MHLKKWLSYGVTFCFTKQIFKLEPSEHFCHQKFSCLVNHLLTHAHTPREGFEGEDKHGKALWDAARLLLNRTVTLRF